MHERRSRNALNKMRTAHYISASARYLDERSRDGGCMLSLEKIGRRSEGETIKCGVISSNDEIQSMTTAMSRKRDKTSKDGRILRERLINFANVKSTTH